MDPFSKKRSLHDHSFVAIEGAKSFTNLGVEIIRALFEKNAS